jgi:O-antigen/teichoic acid export membrane protein
LYPFPAVFKLIFFCWAAGRFIYQSFDPITEFERNYGFSILTELSALAIVLVPLTLGIIKPDVNSILMLIATSFIFRSIVSVIYYRKILLKGVTWFSLPNIKYFLISAFPFFLLTFSGMLQQRIDLFFLALFTTPVETAQYQVFLNLLLLNHVGASLLLSPFAKNIFRMRQSSLQRLESWFIKAGAAISVISIAAIYGVIKIAYGFELPTILYVMGYFYIFMFYLYLLKIYNLRKTQRQSQIALYAFVGCGVNLICSLLFTPRWGIEGAMFAGLMTQIAVVILYYRKTATAQVAAGSVVSE